MPSLTYPMQPQGPRPLTLVPYLPTPQLAIRILDSLPVAVRNEHYNYISRGFPIGFVTPPSYKQPNVHCLYNHVRIVVRTLT